MNLQLQALSFFSMLLCGGVMGLLFDVLRVSRGVLRLHRRWLPLLDLTFWLFSFILVVGVLIRVNSGQLRPPLFLALVMGFILYLCFVGSFWRRLYGWWLRLVLHWVQRFFQFLWRLLVAPLWHFVKFITQAAFFVVSMIAGLAVATGFTVGRSSWRLGAGVWRVASNLIRRSPK